MDEMEECEKKIKERAFFEKKVSKFVKNNNHFE